MAGRFQINPKADDHITHGCVNRLWSNLLARFLLKPPGAMRELATGLNPEGDLRARLVAMDDATLAFMSNLAITAMAELRWRAHGLLPAIGDDDGE